jgi:DNA-binding beta-propeller fold protein YncE
LILDVPTHKELKTFDLGGFSAGILMAPEGSRVFVAVSAKNEVVVVNLKTQEITSRLATGRDPDGLAWAVQH